MMKTILASVLATLLILNSFIANAGVFSGNELLEMIQSKDFENKNAAFFYINGVLEAQVLQAYKDNLRAVKDAKLDESPLCIPDTVTKGQLLDIVKKFLNDNPADRHEQALPLVQYALGKAFNCK